MLNLEDIKDPKSDYFQEALEWQHEKYDSAKKNERRGWLMAFLFALIATTLAFALAMLTPLKEVTPYTIQVDKVTGETSVMKPLSNGTLTQSEALTKYWLIKYIRARVGYDRQDLEKNYELVQIMTDKKEFARYAKAFNPKKADSPYQRYGEKTTIEVRVKSVAFLKENVASIRIDLTEITHDTPTITPWVITMSFQFTLEPKTEAERFDNPLGFQATKWRIDAEVEQGE